MTLTNGPAAGLGSRDPRPALTEPGSLWPPTPDPPQTPGARTSGGFTRLREGGRPPAGPRCWVGLGECAAIAQGPRGLAAPLPTARVATLPCAAHRGARSPPEAGQIPCERVRQGGQLAADPTHAPWRRAGALPRRLGPPSTPPHPLDPAACRLRPPSQREPRTAKAAAPRRVRDPRDAQRAEKGPTTHDVVTQ